MLSTLEHRHGIPLLTHLVLARCAVGAVQAPPQAPVHRRTGNSLSTYRGLTGWGTLAVVPVVAKARTPRRVDSPEARHSCKWGWAQVGKEWLQAGIKDRARRPQTGGSRPRRGVAGNPTLVVALAAGFGVAVALLLVVVVVIVSIHRKRRFARASGPGFPTPLIVR